MTPKFKPADVSDFEKILRRFHRSPDEFDLLETGDNEVTVRERRSARLRIYATGIGLRLSEFEAGSSRWHVWVTMCVSTIMRRTHDAVRPIGFVAFVLLLGGLMITACSPEAWQRAGGVPDPYKNECRSERCAF